MNTASILNTRSATPPAWDATPAVFVVDDDASVRVSLTELIRREGWSAESFASAEEFLSRPRPPGPCCLVLDVALPDLDALDLLKRAAAERDEMPIVFVAESGDVPTAVRAMKAGAVDFLTKPYHEGPLLAAIAQSLERSHAARRKATEIRLQRSALESLTRRERDVMSLVVAGLLNKQVGAELGISEITVKAHRGQVMRKMNVRSLADLVRIASRLGLPDQIVRA